MSDRRTYLVNRSRITLVIGNLVTSKAEVLVSSDDCMLSMGGGVSGALLRAAGDQILAEAAKLVPGQVGDVIVTSAGILPAKYIFHPITIGPREMDIPPDAIVRQAVQKAMRLLALLGCRSAAFPAIGAGIAQIPYDVVASQMAGVLVSTLLDAPEQYSIELYVLDRFGMMPGEQLFASFEQYIGQTLGLAASRTGSGYALKEPTAQAAPHDSEADHDAERRDQVFRMLRHLDTRRDHLEAALVDALAGRSTTTESSLGRIRAQLAEVQELRRTYQEELAPTRRDPSRRVPNSVFLSSTTIDLKPHREALRKLVGRLGFAFVGMEEFSPSVEAPASLIRAKVESAEVYLGVLGMRYGFTEPSTGLSMTELEYRQALASNKELCMFVMDRDAPITAGMVEDHPEGYAKLLDFRKRVLKAHTCAMFKDVPDLVEKAERALEDVRQSATT